MIEKYSKQLKDNKEIRNQNLRKTLELFFKPYSLKKCKLFYVETENTYPSGLDKKENFVLVTGLMPLEQQNKLSKQLHDDAISLSDSHNDNLWEKLYIEQHKVYNLELPKDIQKN